VGSTALSERLDPEDICTVIRAYRNACTDVVTRFDGWVARHLGDGILIYFGWLLSGFGVMGSGLVVNRPREAESL
jgi:class 3 adenylate cyclase